MSLLLPQQSFHHQNRNNLSSLEVRRARKELKTKIANCEQPESPRYQTHLTPTFLLALWLMQILFSLVFYPTTGKCRCDVVAKQNIRKMTFPVIIFHFPRVPFRRAWKATTRDVIEKLSQNKFFRALVGGWMGKSIFNLR